MKRFKEFLKEETTSGDIATVDNKLDMTRRQKGKRCKLHKRINCKECQDKENEKWK